MYNSSRDTFKGEFMRKYDYRSGYDRLLTPQIVNLLSRIHEYKGEQRSLIGAKANMLTQLLEIARIQSTDAFNRIEGIDTRKDRLKKIVMDKTMPRTRGECEIAGYRDVLMTIREDHDYFPPRASIFLQLHRDLYRFSDTNTGGKYREADPAAVGKDGFGNKEVCFEPVPAREAAASLNAACAALEDALNEPALDPLLLIPMFILDFLCIHPFDNGNGRMSRLLTLLLLFRSGYMVGKYISIEKEIEHSRETYYETLRRSSFNWHEAQNDYLPFVTYMLGVLANACREFSDRVQALTTGHLSKPERVEAIIQEHTGKITKAELRQKCPDIAQITIQRALADLMGHEKIQKIGSGRYTSYIWNRENE